MIYRGAQNKRLKTNVDNHYQTAQNIIEVGKRLIQAKSLVNHGHWQNWLEKNFQLSQASATRFMNCAERFGNLATLQSLKSSQMIALLSLPSAEETEKFIAEKAAELFPKTKNSARRGMLKKVDK